jgi:membrane-bound serine protease (ClpP class)
VTAAAAIGVAIMAGRLRRRPPLTGERTLVGKTVEVRRADGQRGQVFLDGAWWGVRSAGGPLAEGTTVRVIDQDGLTLVVQSE